MPTVLRLQAREYTAPARWRWTLTDASGAFLANHEVRLDERDWQFEAATDLHGYISWHASPDEHHAEDEARIVHETGAWLGEHVLGPAITKALVRKRPATVQVIVPPGAEALAFLPLETAHVGGKPLARHDVTLVMQTGEAESDTAPAGQRERLRVLGLFSLPEGGTPLNLRRERHALVKLIHRIAASGKAAEIRVLQYGVTRDRLRDTLEEAEGWDIIHVSGHGLPGELLLETAAGRPDRVGAGDLADLLDGAREHVRLVTLSACWSAAGTDQPHDHPERIGATPQAPAASLAAGLAGSLGCAVLAMRYPVDDEFAIALAGKLYELLAAKGQPLPQAVAMTLKQLARDGDAEGRPFPALSLAAPALFGEPAAQLRLLAPPRTEPRTYRAEDLKMAGFPPQPDRFVGRTAAMARSSAPLAAESRVPGVLLHGMPGGGKTACALELAYTHEHAFEKLVWYKAPDEGSAIDASLTDFALTLERYLDGFQMAHLVSDSAKLAGFLPKLTELLERNRLLIVIDNAESLLTDSGQWRDERWGQVVTALTAHNGLGRLILTTRRVPSGLTALRTEPVDTLTPGEALLLARELPNLRKLSSGELANVLHAASGHPKLLELADGQAANPEQLAALIESEDTPSSTEDYLRVLAAWTNTVVGTLSPAERDLFWFLCCLEEPDRQRPVLNGNWDDLRQRLGRDGNPPDLDQALTAVAARGLTADDGGEDD